MVATMSAPMKPMKAMKATKQLPPRLQWPRGETMRIFIKPMPRGRRISLIVRGSDTVGDVKTMIAAVPNWNIEVDQQLLFFAGTQLVGNDRSISYNGIGGGSVVQLWPLDPLRSIDYFLNAD
jgi:hypothetical protein